MYLCVPVCTAAQPPKDQTPPAVVQLGDVGVPEKPAAHATEGHVPAIVNVAVPLVQLYAVSG